MTTEQIEERNEHRMALSRIALDMATAEDFALILGDDATAEDREAMAAIA